MTDDRRHADGLTRPPPAAVRQDDGDAEGERRRDAAHDLLRERRAVLSAGRNGRC